MSQARLLRGFMALTKNHGHPPTIEELAGHLDQSPSATRSALVRAVENGFMEKRDGHRGYAITPAGIRIAGG